MKTTNFFACLFCTFLLTGAFSCSDDKEKSEVPEEPVRDAFFANGINPIVNIGTNDFRSQVNVYRLSDEGELVVTIQAASDYADLLRLPSSVTFADGQSATSFEIGGTPADFELDKEYPATLTLQDQTVASSQGQTVFDFIFIRQSDPVE